MEFLGGFFICLNFSENINLGAIFAEQQQLWFYQNCTDLEEMNVFSAGKISFSFWKKLLDFRKLDKVFDMSKKACVTVWAHKKPFGWYLVREVDFVGEAVPECPETVGHQGVQLTVGELVQILLQVGPGRLGAGPNRHRLAVVEVGRRTALKWQRIKLIDNHDVETK